MITLHDGDGGLPFISIQNQAGRAKICLLGATVMDYQPAGADPVLWTSPNSRFVVGTPIRGGIPVCWPWFGPHPVNPALPSHGFVRTLLWEVSRAEEELAEHTLVELACHENQETLKLWPHAFILKLRVRVGKDLQLELETNNRGAEEFPFSAALHTYFAISDIGSIQIDGLENTPFLSKVHNYARFVESAPIQIGENVDRVYLDTTAACTIHDQVGITGGVHARRAAQAIDLQAGIIRQNDQFFAVPARNSVVISLGFERRVFSIALPIFDHIQHQANLAW